MYSHCTTGGWILGNEIDGTQAEYVRIPHADTSLYRVPEGAAEDALTMLSDILPTGFECGVLNGRIKPGDAVAIVGAGPIGLAALLTAQFFSPAEIIMIDLDDNRLAVARQFGATQAVNSSDGKAAEAVMAMTGKRGVDTAIEAVGIPATFELCTELVRPGGHVANVGVHGAPATLHLEKLWIHGLTLTMSLVDTSTTARLLKLIAEGRLDPLPFATHRFPLDEVMAAYDTFAAAADTDALKVVLDAAPTIAATSTTEVHAAVVGGRP
jgi:alcohol dehydrogenase